MPRPGVQRFVNPSPEFLEEMGFEAPPNEPVSLRCSFCDKPIVTELEQLHATYGVGKPYKIKRTVVTAEPTSGTLYSEERLLHMNDKQVACENCCLNIKPHFNTKGEQVSPGVKWTPFD